MCDGVMFTNNDDYLKQDLNPKIIPEKLIRNLYSGYASYFDWTDDYDDLESYIQISLNNKLTKHPLLI